MNAIRTEIPLNFETMNTFTRSKTVENFAAAAAPKLEVLQRGPRLVVEANLDSRLLTGYIAFSPSYIDS